jgi:hypothetical protein
VTFCAGAGKVMAVVAGGAGVCANATLGNKAASETPSAKRAFTRLASLLLIFILSSLIFCLPIRLFVLEEILKNPYKIKGFFERTDNRRPLFSRPPIKAGSPRVSSRCGLSTTVKRRQAHFKIFAG